MQILAISGSLRTGSLNTAALKAATLVAPGHVEIGLYDGLGGLPAFNPDLRGSEPQSVLDLRSRLRKADGVLIASPQYAHGIPGALKNALDWLADGNELIGKPIAVLVTSPCYGWTHTLLIETLLNLSANVVGEASILLPLIGPTDERSISGNSKILAALHAATARLADAVREQRLRPTTYALDPRALVANLRVMDLD
jgi:chromate reductase, NAD(P)H dehydrogenase (quinone)